MSAVRQPDDGPRSMFAPSSVQPDVDLDASTPITGNKLAVGSRLDEYEISGVLGEGGFGIVYLAWDHSLQRRLAIKEYMPSSLAWRARGMEVLVKDPRHAESFEAGLRSFINEAKLLASFDHPALLKVHRFFQANGTAYMVMPFYEGVTLKEALASSDRAPDERWLRELLQPLLAALEYMHTAQCFHRDIAPDNVLLIDEGRPLLLDLGAARRVIGDLTKAVTVILKPGYAPIEQYGDLPGIGQGPWTDIYALGAVLHFAITGQVPRASVTRLVADDYVPLAQRLAGRYSDQLLRSIDRMLVVRPEGRPQSIGELRRLMAIELSADSGRIVLPSRMAPDAEPWIRPAVRSAAAVALATSPLPVPPAAPQARAAGPAVAPAVAPAKPAAATPGRGPGPEATAAEAPAPGLPASAWMIGLAVVLGVLFLVGLWRQLAPAWVDPPRPQPASQPAAGVPPAPPAQLPASAVASPASAPDPVPTTASAPTGSPADGPAGAASMASPLPSTSPITSPTTPPITAPTAAPVLPPVASAPAATPAASASAPGLDRPRPVPRPAVAEPKPPRRTEAASPTPGAQTPAAPSPRISASGRCADIIQRVSIGEALTAADRRFLQEECGK